LKTDIPAQIENVLGRIKKSIISEDYRFSLHASKRGEERLISYQDALYVLSRGFHEEKKTVFDHKRKTWKYAIKGKTIDGIEARIIIAFERGMIIITIIRLINKKSRRKL
jgi:hypothetical protein